MELLLLIAASILFALAACRWGVDSRPGFVSKEHELARRGIIWPDRGAAGVLTGIGSPVLPGGAGLGRLRPLRPRLYSRHRLLLRSRGRRPRSRLRG